MIKVGILGTGFGEHHAKLLNKIEGYQVVSIFGRNQDKLKKISSDLNIISTTDINDIIKDPTIDLLDVCLPTELHAKWAIEGIKNNKHILCETPVSDKVDEAEEIRKNSLKYNKNVFVNMFLKFSTPHHMAINISKDKSLGNLISFHSYNKTSPRWGDLSIIKNVETFHIHNIDFAHEIMGMPYKVSASGINLDEKSIVTSILNYKDVYAVIESNSSMPDNYPFRIGFELLFSHGLIKYDSSYGKFSKEEFTIFNKDKSEEKLKLDMKDDYEEVFKHIRSCLKGDRKSELLDIEIAINTIRIKDMILQALNVK